MSYRQKYYIMAENSLRERKTANEKLRQERIDEAEKRIPELKALNAKLSSDGMKIATIIFSGASDAKEQIDALAKDNIAIQNKIHDLLIKYGYRSNQLDPIYTCSYCKDTGVYENRRCKCFLDEVKRFECLALNSSSPMQLSSFDTFDIGFYSDTVRADNGATIRDIMADNLSFCKKYAEDFHLPCGSIVMKGKTGLGKTHLSLAIANHVIQHGHSVIYGSAPDLLRKIEQEHFGNADTDTASLLQETDLLILDDLGAEFESKFYVSALYNIVNTRINSGKPMIINTNMEITELQQRYGDRIASRLLTMEILQFFGTDIRVAKKYAKC